MPFDKFRQQQPGLWKNNAHLFQQDGDGGSVGGWGGMGRPGTRETIRVSEDEEIRASDKRLARVVLLNVLLVALAIVCIVLVGPLAAVLAVPVVIIGGAYIVYPRPQYEHGHNAALDNAQVVVISAAILLSVFWIFMCAQYWWERIVDWYPVKIQLAWYWCAILESVLAAIAAGLNDGRKVFRWTLYDPHWTPTREQAPFWADPTDIQAARPPDDDGYAVDEIRAMLEDAISANNAPRLIPTPVPIYSNGTNPNGNGHKPAPFVGGDPAQSAGWGGDLSPRPDEFESPDGTKILWADFAEFIMRGIQIGISTPTWTRRWKNKKYIGAMQAAARQFGIAKSGGKGSENILLLSSGSEAAAELARIKSRLAAGVAAASAAAAAAGAAANI